jgi:hypothetical protein
VVETSTLVRKGYGRNCCTMFKEVLNNPVPPPSPPPPEGGGSGPSLLDRDSLSLALVSFDTSFFFTCCAARLRPGASTGVSSRVPRARVVWQTQLRGSGGEGTVRRGLEVNPSAHTRAVGAIERRCCAWVRTRPASAAGPAVERGVGWRYLRSTAWYDCSPHDTVSSPTPLRLTPSAAARAEGCDLSVLSFRSGGLRV